MKQAVCLLIINEEDNILSVSRKNDPNDWGLPGGAVERHETLEQAIIREVNEETGLELTSLRVAFISFCGEYETTTFAGHITGDISTNEAGKVAWVSKNQLLKGSFGDYNSRMFKHLRLI